MASSMRSPGRSLVALLAFFAILIVAFSLFHSEGPKSPTFSVRLRDDSTEYTSSRHLLITNLDTQTVRVNRVVLNGRVGKEGCDSDAEPPLPKICVEAGPGCKKRKERWGVVSYYDPKDEGHYHMFFAPMVLATGDQMLLKANYYICGTDIVMVDIFTDRGNFRYSLSRSVGWPE
jgi:hypothetical protein